jgi:hypothetical protein
MSILTRPQGSPERVLSLVAGLAALKGATSRRELESLVNPGFVRGTTQVLVNPKLAGDALGAATGLKLLEADRLEARLGGGDAVVDLPSMADAVHARLRALDPDDSDGVLLETYAWIAAESDRQGSLAWLYDLNADEFADRANEALSGLDEDGKPMNRTKAVAWRRWITFLGLMVALPVEAPNYPLASARIARELQREGLSEGQELSAGAFLALIAQRHPYLDGGRLFTQACQRIGHAANPRRLSALLGEALRDLHDEGVLALKLSGDSADAVALIQDAHPFNAFDAVIYRPSGARA